MSRYMASNTGQLILVPSDLGLLLPLDHRARFFNSIVENELDLSAVCRKSGGHERRGRPGYDPVMLVKIILYGYAEGLTSSREMEQACCERLDFRYLSGNRQPDHRTIASFRKDNLKKLAGLFAQVLSIAIDEELVDMKDVAFDGTNVFANASKRKAMSYDRMRAKVKELKGEIKTLKNERKKAGKRKASDLRSEIKFKKARLKKIHDAKKALEQEMRKEHNRKPKPHEQRNFTDPESRIMKVGGDFEQCYNAQVAVDKKSQIIVAESVRQNANDKQLLEPTVKDVLKNIGLSPDRGLADAGYCSEEVLETLSNQFSSTEWFVATGRLVHGRDQKAPRGRIPNDITETEKMKRRLSTKRGKEIYAQRKAVAEPVFGQIKTANLQFQQFSFRGLKKVRHEWRLVCAVHNLLKIYRHRMRCSRLELAHVV